MTEYPYGGAVDHTQSELPEVQERRNMATQEEWYHGWEADPRPPPTRRPTPTTRLSTTPLPPYTIDNPWIAERTYEEENPVDTHQQAQNHQLPQLQPKMAH